MSKNVFQKLKRFRKFYPPQFRFIFTQKNMTVFSILLKKATLQQKEQSKVKDNGVCKSVLEQGYQAILNQSPNRQSHRELLHKPPEAPNVARMQTSLSKQ